MYIHGWPPLVATSQPWRQVGSCVTDLRSGSAWFMAHHSAVHCAVTVVLGIVVTALIVLYEAAFDSARRTSDICGCRPTPSCTACIVGVSLMQANFIASRQSPCALSCTLPQLTNDLTTIPTPVLLFLASLYASQTPVVKPVRTGVIQRHIRALCATQNGAFIGFWIG